MKIAVTGATGFLGHYLVNHLTRLGHDCRCWRRETSDTGGFDHPDRIEWQIGELDDPSATQQLVRDVDAVVHAALAWPSQTELVEFVQRNVVGSIRLMEAARSASVERFVFISTCAVHEVILDDRKLDEAHPLWPMRHYGAHKAAIEKFVHSYGLGDGWPVCALRPTGIYGLARPVGQSRWFETVQRVVRGEDVDSASGGKEVHAADVARAVTLLLEAKADDIAGRSFNCYDRYIADAEVAQIAKEIAGSSSEITNRNPGPKHQIDTSRIRALGMRFGGDEMLRQTVTELVEAAR
ncbi:MAG: NAD-dependent epimerase/dehydratase family protein [Phycisphaeraceae bacterium]